MIEDMLQDFRFGLRGLWRRPLLTLVVAVTLALAIGANTAVFSLVDGILLRPLPFPEPHELVNVWADYTARQGPDQEWLNYPNFHDLRQQSRTLEEVALYSGTLLTLTGRDEPQQILGAQVTEGMFSRVLKIGPKKGRTFNPEEDRPNAAGTIILSHQFYQRVFAGEPALGSSLILNDQPYTVIAIMPEDFRPPFLPNAEFWTPLQMTMADNTCGRGGACLRAIGRLAEEITLEEAQTELSQIAARLEAAYPENNTGVGLKVIPTRDNMVAPAKTALQVLLAAVLAILLIACVNVANLFLARATDRQGELAIRSALGARRGRIVRQLLTESTLLALLGGLLGVGLGIAGTRLLVAQAPAQTPRLEVVSVDTRILIFTLAVTALSGIIFGLFPALRASRRDLHLVLRGTGRSEVGFRSNRLRGALVVSQVALALVLLVGAGLLVKSLRNLQTADLGFDPKGVITMRIGLPGSRYEDRAAALTFFQELNDRLAGLSSVAQFGATTTVPLSQFDGDLNFTVEGQPIPPPGKENQVWFRRITPGYFETMRIDVVAGRNFTSSDDRQAPPVVIINQTLAERYFPDRNPVGQRLNINNPSEPVWREIVGVARDIRNFGIRQDSRNAMYVPFFQLPTQNLFYVLRSRTEQEALIAEVRAQVIEMDPKLALANIIPMEALVAQSISEDRFTMTLLGLFAVVALFLAAVGLYGVVSYSVTTRFKEVGVRMALGADRWEIGRQVIGRSLILVLFGAGIGLLGALATTRLMETLLFGVETTDLQTFLSVVAVLFGIAIAASAVPALRATRVDPAAVLRDE